MQISHHLQNSVGLLGFTSGQETMESRRLNCLYEISKNLVNFESVEKNLSEMITTLASAVYIKTIVLTEETKSNLNISIWYDSNANEESIAHAIGQSGPLSPFSIHKYSLPLYSVATSERTKYLSMKLETGTFQVECLETIDEAEEKYIKSFTNSIASVLKKNNRDIELDKINKYVDGLEEERSLRDQFVATLTHDLRTPLTAAKMGAQMILRKPGEVERSKQSAVQIIRSIDRLDQMVQDLLDVNRIRAGVGLSLTMNYCNLKDVALLAIRDLASIYGDRFVLKVNQANIFGFWNEDGLRRVIENLAGNAAKYGSSDKLISIILRQSDQFVEVTVHNFGPTISKEEQLELFKPFHRSNVVKKSNKKGWGLGLTLVRGVVDAHGGKISIDSSEMEGTKFTAIIPKDSRSFQILN